MRSQLRCGLLLLVMSLLIAPLAQNSSTSPVQAQMARPEQTLAPLMFVENVGQFDPGARFVLPGARTTLFLADNALWLTAVERDPSSSESATRGVNLRLSFVGAAPHPRLEPFGQLDTAISYIAGLYHGIYRLTGLPYHRRRAVPGNRRRARR